MTVTSTLVYRSSAPPKKTLWAKRSRGYHTLPARCQRQQRPNSNINAIFDRTSAFAALGIPPEIRLQCARLLTVIRRWGGPGSPDANALAFSIEDNYFD